MNRLVPLWALAALVALSSVASAQRLAPRTLTASGAFVTLETTAAMRAVTITPPDWTARLDPAARALALGGTEAAERLGIPLGRSASGNDTVDLFVQTVPGASDVALRGLPGVEIRAVVGDISVVRVPIAGLEGLARDASVRYIEASQMREPLNETGRADMRVDAVHSGGGGLPRAFDGAGVVVGVLDSGLDVTHPDFFNAGGSRVQYLLEFLQGGGQREFTKAQIDANPAGIPERDGNGGGGHGTHVTGSAAGAGGINASMRGVAPASDLVFVKGIRDADSNGGFSDADVIAGADFVFQRAATLGRPAVLNLSLGGHYGSHDGTSLYEQALSGLAGPGKIIVAAAGNEGDNAVHAGHTSQPNQINETLLFASSPSYVGTTLWYDGGVLAEFGIRAYSVVNGQLNYLGQMVVPAGQVLGGAQGAPFNVNGTVIANVGIDASTTQDPRNGDGNVDFQIVGVPGMDLRDLVWSIVSVGTTTGRIDQWAISGEFFTGTAGLQGVREMPGNIQSTVGIPSTATGVVAVGAHVTHTTWTDVDGNPRQLTNPNPDGNPNSPQVNPSNGQLSYFSSNGPTRDGRTSPDITGPGELIFSTLSSHVSVGTQGGVPRSRVAQGGGYQGLEGTSMASPHVAGAVALMLQANPALTPDGVRQILQQTARADGFTGGLPNNRFGSGKADALSAVLRTIELCGSSCGTTTGSVFAEAEPNNTFAEAQSLGGGAPITLNGQAASTDVGAVVISYNDGSRDDVEDLFRITTTAAGLTLSLGGYNQDLDLVLFDAAGQIVEISNSVNPTETISVAGLPAGTYTVGVSFYDAGTESGQTPYVLTATGAFSVSGEDDPDASGLALRSVYPNPVRASAQVDFHLPAPADVRVAVYDVLGRQVALVTDGLHGAGEHSAALDASALSSGIYIVRLTTPTGARTQRLVVAR